MNKKQLFLTAFALAHVAIMASSAFRLRQTGCDWIDRVIGTYAFVTGSGDNFGFFCSVPNQVRPTFAITDRDGTVHTDHLWPETVNREAALRYGVSVSMFGNLDDKSRKALLGSWSAAMFGRHPNAARVNVRLEAYVVPDWSKSPADAAPRWVEMYSADFENDSAASQANCNHGF